MEVGVEMSWQMWREAHDQTEMEDDADDNVHSPSEPPSPPHFPSSATLRSPLVYGVNIGELFSKLTCYNNTLIQGNSLVSPPTPFPFLPLTLQEGTEAAGSSTQSAKDSNPLCNIEMAKSQTALETADVDVRRCSPPDDVEVEMPQPPVTGSVAGSVVAENVTECDKSQSPSPTGERLRSTTTAQSYSPDPDSNSPDSLGPTETQDASEVPISGSSASAAFEDVSDFVSPSLATKDDDVPACPPEASSPTIDAPGSGSCVSLRPATMLSPWNNCGNCEPGSVRSERTPSPSTTPPSPWTLPGTLYTKTFVGSTWAPSIPLASLLNSDDCNTRLSLFEPSSDTSDGPSRSITLAVEPGYGNIGFGLVNRAGHPYPRQERRPVLNLSSRGSYTAQAPSPFRQRPLDGHSSRMFARSSLVPTTSAMRHTVATHVDPPCSPQHGTHSDGPHHTMDARQERSTSPSGHSDVPAFAISTVPDMTVMEEDEVDHDLQLPAEDDQPLEQASSSQYVLTAMARN